MTDQSFKKIKKIKNDIKNKKKLKIILKIKIVKETREGTLDSELLVLSSSLALEQAKRIQTHFHTYNPTDLVDNCKRIMTERENGKCDWKKMTEITSQYINTAPSLSFLYGTLNIVPKEKKKIARKQKEKIEKRVTANVVKDNEDEEEEGIDPIKQVKRVHEYLMGATKDKNKLPFYQFILDHNSFGHTSIYFLNFF